MTQEPIQEPLLDTVLKVPPERADLYEVYPHVALGDFQRLISQALGVPAEG